MIRKSLSPDHPARPLDALDLLSLVRQCVAPMRGNRTLNVEPTPTSDSTSTTPPCRRARAAAM